MPSASATCRRLQRCLRPRPRCTGGAPCVHRPWWPLEQAAATRRCPSTTAAVVTAAGGDDASARKRSALRCAMFTLAQAGHFDTAAPLPLPRRHLCSCPRGVYTNARGPTAGASTSASRSVAREWCCVHTRTRTRTCTCPRTRTSSFVSGVKSVCPSVAMVQRTSSSRTYAVSSPCHVCVCVCVCVCVVTVHYLSIILKFPLCMVVFHGSGC